MRDEQIINSREMILKVFSNIDKKRFEEELKEKEEEYNKLSSTLTEEQKRIEEIKEKLDEQ